MFPQFEYVNPTPNAGDSFGSSIVEAGNGATLIVTDPGDDAVATDAGAVYLYNRVTGQLISTLTGSTASDQVGNNAPIAMSNGHYVVRSINWDNGTVTNAGAATWGNGTTGITGVVSSSNSLVGSTASDQVGVTGVTALSNGHYVVGSHSWDNGTRVDAGAVTWGNGSSGISGVITATNSLVGNTANQAVGGSVISHSDGSFTASGSGAGGIVLGGTPDLSHLTFNRWQAGTVTLTPDILLQQLNAGTAVTLQANTDITVNSAITVTNPGGAGGALTLQAGRSVLINAAITTDDGALALYANSPVSDGTIDSERAAGTAVITLGGAINTGAGAFLAAIKNGSGLTSSAQGGITTSAAITAGSISLTTTSSAITLASGASLSGAGTGDVIQLSAGTTFTNSSGSSSPISVTGGGRYMIYSSSPLTDSYGGMSRPNKRYNFTYGSSTAGLSGGPWFLYSLTPTLTVAADAQSKVYGTANPSLTFAVTGLIDGDTAGTALTGSVTTSATASSGVGSYTITQGTLAASALGYTLSSYTAGTLSITPAALTITADSLSKTYGTANPTLTASTSGLVNSDTAAVISGVSLSTTATASSGVGSYSITASGGTASNYTITYVSGSLTINPALLTVTASSGQGKVYGSSDPTLTYALTSGALVGSDSFSGSLSRAAGANVGSYAIGQGTLTAGSNYTLTYVGANFSITPAALTITADSLSKTYGTANPTLTASTSGLVNSDTAAVISGVSLSTTATASSGVGSYAITASGGTASNYTITHVSGSLTVNPAALRLIVTDASRRVGEANPAFSYTLLGLVGADTPAVFTGATLASMAHLTSPAGRYAITASGGSASNYVLTDVVSGALEVLVPTPAILAHGPKALIRQLHSGAPAWPQVQDKHPVTPADAVFDGRNPSGNVYDPYGMTFSLGTVDDALEAKLLAQEPWRQGQPPRISRFKLFITDFWSYLQSRNH